MPSSAPSRAPSIYQITEPPLEPSKAGTACFQTNSELRSRLPNWSTPNNEALVVVQYGPIGEWCFGAGATSMDLLFSGRSTFNEDIGNWEVASVTSMSGMFQGASSFNQDLSSWNLSSVTNMDKMFESATAFDQDLSSWEVSSVYTMQPMFAQASSFNHDLPQWNVSSVTNMNGIF